MIGGTDGAWYGVAADVNQTTERGGKMDKSVTDYAQARANETGRPYLITVFGHCFMDCPQNRKLALDPELGEGIAARVLPNYTQA